MNSNVAAEEVGFFSREVDVNARIAIFAMAWGLAYAYMFEAVLPGLIGGLVDSLGFTEADAGYVASAQLIGMLIGAVIATFSVRRVNLRVGTMIGLVVMVLIELASSTVHQAGTLIVLRLISGTAAGFIAGLCAAGLSATKNPDGGFAVVIMLQFIVGAIGLYAMPHLVSSGGVAVAFYCLAGLGVTCLLLISKIPVAGHADEMYGEAMPSLLRLPVILTLGSLLLYYIFNNAVWAYLDRIGVDAGISVNTVGLALGVSMLGGILGAVLSMVIGVRLGRILPITIGLLLYMVGTAILGFRFDTVAYFGATFLLNATLAFVVAYMLGACAVLDGIGRVVVLGNMMIALGLALGPALAANLLVGTDYAWVIWSSVAGVGASLVFILLASFLVRLER